MAKKFLEMNPDLFNLYPPGLGHLGCLFWQNLELMLTFSSYRHQNDLPGHLSKALLI